MSEFAETDVLIDEPAARNPLVLVLAVVGAVLAAAAVWFFVAAPLLGGGTDVETPATPSAAAPDEVATAPTTDAPLEEPVEDAVLPVVTYEVFLDRDPFDAVVPEPVSAAATEGFETVDGADGAVTDGTAGGTTDVVSGGETEDTTSGGTEGTTGGTGGGSTAGGCTSGEQLVCDGRVVSVVDIRTADDGERVAIVQVDTTLYEARVGETFAGSFRVQSITGERVYLLYGDDAFELREGERVLK